MRYSKTTGPERIVESRIGQMNISPCETDVEYLRRQLKCIEDAKRAQKQEELDRLEAEKLREKIRQHGFKPGR